MISVFLFTVDRISSASFSVANLASVAISALSFISWASCLAWLIILSASISASCCAVILMLAASCSAFVTVVSRSGSSEAPCCATRSLTESTTCFSSRPLFTVLDSLSPKSLVFRTLLPFLLFLLNRLVNHLNIGLILISLSSIRVNLPLIYWSIIKL